MTVQDFAAYAVSRGMIVVDNMAFGELKGYPFTLLAVGSPNVRAMTVQFKLASRVPNKVFKSIRKTVKANGRLFYMNNSPLVVALTCSGPDNAVWDRLFAGMEGIVQGFMGAGISIPDTCPFCKNGACDSLAYVGDGYVPVHKACCESQSFGTMEKAEANERSGHYITGIIGALLGGIVASIPTILLMWFAEMISAWLYALIPLGAYFGYRLFKGKMNRIVLPIVILVSVFMLFFVQQVMWFLVLHEEFGFWPYINESIEYFFMLVPTEDMIVDLIKPAIFTVLGIVISYSVIRQNNQSDIKQADIVLRSLFVKNGGQFAAEAAQPVPPVEPVQNYTTAEADTTTEQ